MSDQNDISMLDVSNALDSIGAEAAPPAPARRKSTLILTDDGEPENTNTGRATDPAQSGAMAASAAEPTAPQTQPARPELPGPAPDASATVPVDISWLQGGDKVYVTGSFTGWRKMIGLQSQPDGTHVVTLGLPVGTHRFRFVIDNELRFSDFLPTATDQMGNFVNYVEVTPEHVQMHMRQQRSLEEQQQQKQAREQAAQQLRQGLRQRALAGRPRSDLIFKFISDDDDMGNGYLRYYDDDADAAADRRYNYISDIPPIFVEPKVMEQYYMAVDEQAKAQNGQQAWLHPPQLPPQLDHVILNNFNSMDRHNNSGALPIPNHVVLNHLATTSIKHNTLAVASVVRYKHKYVTQVLYAPLLQ
ncbi:AMPKBI-domain-containing protein [Metschnikowia bicuspidata var. bicuspidata NRRL YB-4993]|uniref:AMPKBI-domain-containing protein n=1 Tax=Metschnikowia bicuspidata var. bicuspidata NRRL YB-4993 TaxID=869754 RepID=A0A1A0H2B0_9ASCO|nr:AMPKBI-domain-containing protein [Metschnikowia bicuspidata var. bicuspidata NRRL YB-4993]OBA18062.1 AMPKBI-domain-containing protein [Metschnikowia bicuspidata var. bicuspidata NRRL YB-4993]